jgi:hypothetical protein
MAELLPWHVLQDKVFLQAFILAPLWHAEMAAVQMKQFVEVEES